LIASGDGRVSASASANAGGHVTSIWNAGDRVSETAIDAEEAS
jgi:hypothetical protein